jgi:hypothetical protein
MKTHGGAANASRLLKQAKGVLACVWVIVEIVHAL